MSRLRKCALLCAALAWPGLPVWADVTWRVDNPAEMARILPAAAVGDVFEMGPGDWGPISLRGVSGVELRALDPLMPPVLDGLDLSDTSDITIDGLRVELDGKGPAIDLTNAKAVILNGLEIRGQHMGLGFDVTGSRDVKISGVRLQDLGSGLRGTDPRHLTLVQTEMTGLTGAAVSLVGGQWLTLDSNLIHSFSPEREHPDLRYPDMVQLNVSETAAPAHILIKDNLIDSGAGPARRGLFVGDAFELRSDLAPMRDVTISGNVVVTAGIHGLFVGPAEGVRVDGNAVLRTRQGAHRAESAKKTSPELRLSDRSSGVVLTDNWGAHVPSGLGLPGWDVRDNQIAQDIYPGRADHYDALFSAPDNADALLAFRPRPGSAIDKPGSGPGLLSRDLADEPTTPLLTVAPKPDEPYVLLRYDPEDGAMVSFDAQGVPRLSEPVDPGTIALGDAFPLYQVSRPLIAPVFDSRDFALNVTLRGRDGWGTGGEVLRIHDWMILNVDNGGAVILHFRSADSAWKKLVLRNTRVGPEAWLPVEIGFDTRTADGVLTLRAGDDAVMDVAIHGPTPPMQTWDLTLGNPFGDRDTWEGEIGALSLTRRARP